MSHTVKFQETLRRLTMIDEGFVEGQAGLGFDLAGAAALDARTVALLRLGAAAAIGSPGICLEWSTGRALAAGASEDEIAGVLLAKPAKDGCVVTRGQGFNPRDRSCSRRPRSPGTCWPGGPNLLLSGALVWSRNGEA